MGIQGLLPLLKEISNPIHINQYKGKTLAVDAYVSSFFLLSSFSQLNN